MADIPPPRSPRLDSIDVLRGLVMVLMALDHTRDFFARPEIQDLSNLEQKPSALFFTRWVTHFCAPTFVFLAGAGAYLAGSRGMSRGQLSLFLLTRGLWLVFLEITLIYVGWWAKWDPSVLIGQVIWAIGASMVLLSLVVWLPSEVIGLIGFAIIVLHNLLDGVPLKDGTFQRLVDFLFNFSVTVYQPPEFLRRAGEFVQQLQGIKPVEMWNIFVPYPLMPWFGVLALGYGLGSVLGSGDSTRRPRLFAIGLAFIVAFVALRVPNWYGDTRAWTNPRGDSLTTVQAILNCEKYPPSLCYVLMTLGPALMLLSVLPDRAPAFLKPLVIFGRVPLFFYLLHLPVLHLSSTLATYWRLGIVSFEYPPQLLGSGYDLAGVYTAWALMVVLLYGPCWWFAGVKRRHPGGWLSYL